MTNHRVFKLKTMMSRVLIAVSVTFALAIAMLITTVYAQTGGDQSGGGVGGDQGQGGGGAGGGTDQSGTQTGGGQDNQPPAGGSTTCGGNDVECDKSIVQNTYQILVRVNNVPEQLKNISTTALSWIAKDDSKLTSTIQSYFVTLGQMINTEKDSQKDLIKQLNVDLFSPDDKDAFTLPSPEKPKILDTTPNINALTYGTVLGSPPVPKNSDMPAAILTYIENAAGVNIFHEKPNLSWRPSENNTNALGQYFAYWNTTMAIESFNAYTLSNLAVETQNKFAIAEAQKQLVKQATNQDWLTEIASQDLGKTLRQLLLFQSQTYVLLTQLVQLQKQILTAQVMQNSLIILTNQNEEQLMVSKANGTMK